MKPKIRSSQYEYEMTDWLLDHSQALLTEAIELSAELRSTAKQNDEALIKLNSIITNSSKLLAFASGGDWAEQDVKMLLAEGSAGLEKLLVKYGLLEETSEDIEKQNIASFVTKLKPLIYEPAQVIRDESRQILSGYGFSQTLIDRIIEMLGHVSRGELKWVEFVAQATELFKKETS
ncbi:MAG: hypothetical protein IZT57_04050 [Chloroflexi bacterium]|jgi:hypothetical protein|nr:hypothetical protein [Chloroflexota bacterium]